MSAITGIPSPTVKIPFAVAATYAFFEEWITGRIRGREPRATLEEVRMGRKKMFASSARAQQELGFRIVPVYPAMRAAIEWFRANGYAPPRRDSAMAPAHDPNRHHRRHPRRTEAAGARLAAQHPQWRRVLGAARRRRRVDRRLRRSRPGGRDTRLCRHRGRRPIDLVFSVGWAGA